VTGFNAGGYVALVGHGAASTALAGVLVPTRRRWATVAAFPAAVIVSDWLRGHYPFGGLPLGGIALGQAGGPLVPTARLGGALLVAGVAALAGAALAELADSIRLGDRAAALRGALAVMIVIALAAAGRVAPDGAGNGPRNLLRVALVQGGGPRGLQSVETD